MTKTQSDLRSSDLIVTEIVFAALKNLITEGGMANAERISDRLSMPFEALVAWFERPEHGFKIGKAENAALTTIRRFGIRVSYRSYVAQYR